MQAYGAEFGGGLGVVVDAPADSNVLAACSAPARPSSCIRPVARRQAARTRLCSSSVLPRPARACRSRTPPSPVSTLAPTWRGRAGNANFDGVQRGVVRCRRAGRGQPPEPLVGQVHKPPGELVAQPPEKAEDDVGVGKRCRWPPAPVRKELVNRRRSSRLVDSPARGRHNPGVCQTCGWSPYGCGSAARRSFSAAHAYSAASWPPRVNRVPGGAARS